MKGVGASHGPSQDPSGVLLVVEDNVRDPDHLRRDSEGCDVAELGRVPAQLVVAPLLCVGRGVRAPGAAREEVSGQTRGSPGTPQQPDSGALTRARHPAPRSRKGSGLGVRSLVGHGQSLALPQLSCPESGAHKSL